MASRSHWARIASARTSSEDSDDEWLLRDRHQPEMPVTPRVAVVAVQRAHDRDRRRHRRQRVTDQAFVTGRSRVD